MRIITNSLENKIRYRINRSKYSSFILSDFSDLSDRDQVLRVLRKLISENKLIRLGQGVYARAKISTITNKPIPEKNLRALAITALKKSGIRIFPTRMENEYNEGRSTQVPTGLVIGVNKRVSRKIGFNERYIKYEKVSQS
ncbi:MAG TPA: hypothetical protein DD381_13295 [Lentisphaeria bacterium]|nr:MAG: hypothetical protein A2X47_11770 [Lentisphaerae bacterium GWF2_38_69]HBM17297.1 hypothetical protein [Lentisphaeria bacterium]